MSTKTLLAAVAGLGLAGFLLSQPALSSTTTALDHGARTANSQSAVMVAQADTKKKKGKKKSGEKKKKKSGKKSSGN